MLVKAMICCFSFPIDHISGEELSLHLQGLEVSTFNQPPPGGAMFPPSRESSHLSSARLPDKLSRLGVTSSMLAGAGMTEAGGAKLEGLLTISSKALQTRERSNLQYVPAISTLAILLWGSSKCQLCL